MQNGETVRSYLHPTCAVGPVHLQLSTESKDFCLKGVNNAFLNQFATVGLLQTCITPDELCGP